MPTLSSHKHSSVLSVSDDTMVDYETQPVQVTLASRHMLRYQITVVKEIAYLTL